MDVFNPLYKNQGIHAIISLFTVEDGITKVLLIKRKREPYKNKWILVGGSVYNNEDVYDGAIRELKEKTGITDINLKQYFTFGRVDRSPVMRMVAVCYIGLIDSKRVNLLKETDTIIDADWFQINKVPELGYDHREILDVSIEILRKEIVKTNILKSLFPGEFTMPEVQKVYETILNRQFDRRNFRKKILQLGLVDDLEKVTNDTNGRPAKLYRFKDKIEEKELF